MLVPDAGKLHEHAASLREPLKLPPGRTEDEALARAVAHRRFLWANLKNEDERLTELERFCTRLCDGDRASGKRLAGMAGASVTDYAKAAMQELGHIAKAKLDYDKRTEQAQKFLRFERDENDGGLPK